MGFENEILEIIKEISGDRNVSLASKLIGVESQVDSLSIIEILVKVQNFAKDKGLVFEWSMENLITDGQKPFLTVQDLLLNFTSQNNLQ